MNISEKTLNYLKSITAETVSNASSGHTGSALGASSIMLALFRDHMHFDPTNPKWLNRDRLVLSAGHTSAMFYTLLHLFGYDISIEDLKNFRKYGSKTPGHPEYKVVPGAEVTTGPLGQGIANAVGMAIAETKLNALFPNEINNHTFCYTGDGCLMEGVGIEACSLAGTLKLNKLILLYDDNDITIDGNKDLANQENIKAKFEAMNWNVIDVKNGHDIDACSNAIKKAKKSDKPTIIIFKTVIGIGTSKAGTSKAHAYPLPAEELALFKQSLGIEGSFFIPEDVYAFCREISNRNIENSKLWEKNNKDIHEKLTRFSCNNFDYEHLVKTLNETPEQAGRDVSSIVLNELVERFYFVGGTADVGPSTKAVITKAPDYSSENRRGRNIHFGIREHSMGSICNGLAASSNFFVFDSTFLAFSNYMLPALKMRGLMNVPVLSIFTHDSIDVGEDGPTHQPIEQIGQLRSLIGLDVFRPSNFAEIVAGYKHFIESRRPTALILSKSKLKANPSATIEKALRGGYVAFETKTKPQIEIIATGKEVDLAIQVANELESVGARVISMPCEKIFDNQDKTYKNSVRLKNPALKVVIEASNDTLWYKYIGDNGLLINVTEYQHSGKSKEVYEKAGFTVSHIKTQIAKKLK